MSKVRPILFCLLLAFSLSVRAADTNSLVWHTATDRVSADVRGERLWPLLEDIAHQTGWHIFVEPDTERNASVKFKNLPSGAALKMLLGDLNFALVPKINAPSQLYVFRTTIQNATKQVRVAKAPRRVANELLLRVKPGTDIDALAKSLGAKIVGRLDKLGLYRLQFGDAAATDAALAQLQNNSDVAAVDYNYILDPPPSVQPVSSANLPAGAAAPLSLQLNPPGSSGKVIIGLIDMNVQSLDPILINLFCRKFPCPVTPRRTTPISPMPRPCFTICIRPSTWCRPVALLCKSSRWIFMAGARPRPLGVRHLEFRRLWTRARPS
jgi:hypothetical protein